MQVTIYGVQPEETGRLLSLTVKVFYDGKEIVEVPKNQQVTLDVPEGDILEFKCKNAGIEMSTEIDVIGNSIVLSWQGRVHSIFAFATNYPDRIIARIKKASKRGCLMALLGVG